MLRVSLALLLAAAQPVASFKFMANWKVRPIHQPRFARAHPGTHRPLRTLPTRLCEVAQLLRRSDGGFSAGARERVASLCARERVASLCAHAPPSTASHHSPSLRPLSRGQAPTLKNIRDSKVAAAKFGDKKLVVITGTSSGLGRKTARALLRTGQYHVVGAVRDLEKMEAVAEIEEFDSDSFTPMHVELNSFESVRSFCSELETFKAAKPIDRLICNAAVYQPSLPYAKWSADGHEQQVQINPPADQTPCRQTPLQTNPPADQPPCPAPPHTKSPSP